MRSSRRSHKKKGFIIAAFACFLCLSAIMVGATVLNKKGNKTKNGTEDIVDLNDTKKVAENDTTPEDNVAVDGKVSKEDETTLSNVKTIKDNEETKKADEDNRLDNNDENDLNKDVSNVIQQPTESQVQDNSPVSANVAQISFDENTKLKWPIEGSIILDYNMENTIYFSTLDSYKCNPAIIIQGEKGLEVMAGVTGIVESVSSNDEIGKYVVLNLGNEYKLTFGQLENISVAEGQTVSSDTCIGVVAEPTKYYTKEGANLYYMLTKSGEPCDPVDYLN